ncbi:hypothetical protein SERLADRAFT_439968 [Serpula lacrymans var. lacrymans S7.9]|uniref:Uncharacterized protein n=1 Tax=Serpula lacrymans var. lacrymans (strain S7.9) TaxID=578457 RepID=F8P247_SERL9|nr:uncharacterized protein SERLADRAFT_439968 [Serpula lacrymans var. lacrymans S7.9]EGO23225.1 hypothetical protein SERLADRAFT_439968 [Serpula lacrymans var. lacrymans S7.9]
MSTVQADIIVEQEPNIRVFNFTLAAGYNRHPSSLELKSVALNVAKNNNFQGDNNIPVAATLFKPEPTTKTHQKPSMSHSESGRLVPEQL